MIRARTSGKRKRIILFYARWLVLVRFSAMVPTRTRREQKKRSPSSARWRELVQLIIFATKRSPSSARWRELVQLIIFAAIATIIRVRTRRNRKRRVPFSARWLVSVLLISFSVMIRRRLSFSDRWFVQCKELYFRPLGIGHWTFLGIIV